MKFFDTEYKIEIYNERTREWEVHISNFLSKDAAIKTLEERRKHYVNSTYRLVELTILTKILNV